jgi:N6-L-threonylcarbamoyladenine synthase
MTLILGIETSCDETAAAIVADGREIHSNVVSSQIALHAQYGGIYPEMASREHVLKIVPVVERALLEGGASWKDLDAIAVTYGPGLAGSLLVGVNFAKGLALAKDVPLLGINHLEGHIYASWLALGPAGKAGPTPDPHPGSALQRARPEVITSGDHLWAGGLAAGSGSAAQPLPEFPLLCLIVSGGHTELIVMRGHGQYEQLGSTRDDAAGEAFDKVARLLGLGYPGGPAIQQAAEGASTDDLRFPRAWLERTHDFSFSGLKTAVLNHVHHERLDRETSDSAEMADIATRKAQIAHAFQEAVVDVLVEKTRLAAEQYSVRMVLVGGGVAANQRLREQMRARIAVPVLIPPIALCTDNGAVIAAAGHFRFSAGERSGWDLDVVPGLRLVRGAQKG